MRYIKDISNGDSPFLLKKNTFYNHSLGFTEDKFSKFNICHLLLDKLPRAYDFKEEEIDAFMLFNENKYIADVSEKLGLKIFQLENISGVKTTIRFKEITLSSSSSYDFIHPGQNIYNNTKILINKLSNAVSSDDTNKHKIFIDRQAALTRKTLNHDEVYNYFKKEGFLFVKLEDLSLSEQIKIFKEAECIVGVHGAGMVNIAFCQKGTKILEIMPPLCATSAYWKLANAMDLKYDCVLADDPSFPKPDYTKWQHEPAKYNRRDVVLNIEKIKTSLDNLLKSDHQKNSY